jgi:hypothetical protein
MGSVIGIIVYETMCIYIGVICLFRIEHLRERTLSRLSHLSFLVPWIEGRGYTYATRATGVLAFTMSLIGVVAILRALMR